MDFYNYHKECGHRVGFQHEETTGYCPMCNKEVELKDTISKHTRDARIAQLKAMHNMMCQANDEEIYMTWVSLGVPDCPSEDDFLFIAMSNEQYNECFDLFVKLIAKSGNRY